MVLPCLSTTRRRCGLALWHGPRHSWGEGVTEGQNGRGIAGEERFGKMDERKVREGKGGMDGWMEVVVYRLKGR